MKTIVVTGLMDNLPYYLNVDQICLLYSDERGETCVDFGNGINAFHIQEDLTAVLNMCSKYDEKQKGQ